MGKINVRPGTLLRWHALKRVLESEIKEGSTIFDIGGYDGFISYNLKKLFPKLNITTIDIDKAGLQEATERGLNVLYASALELPIKTNQADVVLCLDIIEHIKEDHKLIKEISRVLKGDGKVILTTPMQDGVSFPFLGKEKIETIERNWEHVHKGYSLEDIKKLFENNNLVIEKTSKCFNFFSRFAYLFGFLARIPLKGKSLFYRAIVRLEPYIKYGAEEYIIIGKKVKP